MRKSAGNNSLTGLSALAIVTGIETGDCDAR